MARYHFQVFRLKSHPQAPGGAFGHWIRVGLMLVFLALLLFLMVAIGWFFLMLLILASIPLLIRTGYANWRHRHASGPDGADSESRLFEGEWRPIEEHPIKDDLPHP